ncbi:hypothetical protein QF030_005843 [Streptomyces rishiriensis]|uniref:Uncharacterized protein n=1 Tax=Streptomyces rishiriensis TaxID=68264 RepID=A0ABU0NX03_STRRH|nr:hypothetical protein [Streptomyces rishiriensis]
MGGPSRFGRGRPPVSGATAGRGTATTSGAGAGRARDTGTKKGPLRAEGPLLDVQAAERRSA